LKPVNNVVVVVVVVVGCGVVPTAKNLNVVWAEPPRFEAVTTYVPASTVKPAL
jgi:hypothetical protein